MDKTIIEVLTKLEDNGFEAYIVGGYVRDFLLGKHSSDIDICTNALPKDLVNIFNSGNVTNSNYGSIKIITNKYNFDITTYRKEISYNDRRPDEIEYVNNLVDDINRRDFTINTFCMNKKQEIIDLLDAKKDLDNRIVRCIGNVGKRLEEDPLRIIRALRFASTLDFTLEKELQEKIINKKDLVKTVSKTRIKSEMDRVLFNENAIKGLEMFKDTGVLDALNISYDKLIYVDDLMGMYSQIRVPEDYPFTKSEKKTINDIRNIVTQGKIDANVLFEYDLYISLVAGSILDISHKEINEMYNNLPIKSINELDIEVDSICKILDIKPSNILKEIQKDLINQILSNRLINHNSDIIDYIITNQGKWLNERDTK